MLQIKPHGNSDPTRANTFKLYIKGDRGIIDIQLTREEAEDLLQKSPFDPQQDALSFTLNLVPGAVEGLRRQLAGEQGVDPLNMVSPTAQRAEQGVATA